MADTYPAWVYKRDNRLEPFDPDRISQDLFAATQELGQANAFLAREMTDGVLHFLGPECAGNIPTTAQIGELIVKVVRELGQPDLSQAFSRRLQEDEPERYALEKQLSQSIMCRLSVQDSPEQARRKSISAYSLGAVFSPDVAAAHEEGIIFLTGLDSPAELAACVERRAWSAERGTPGAASERIAASLLAAQKKCGGYVVLDGPEHDLSESLESRSFLRQLEGILSLSGQGAVINLNCAVPPPGAMTQSPGPLFSLFTQEEPGNTRGSSPSAIEEILEWIREPERPLPVRVDWHLGERDFQDLPGLCRFLDRCPTGPNLAFTFDRPRRPIALAEGITRQNPAVLLMVGLNLPWLARLEAIDLDLDRFLKKLSSLIRMAVSAGVQKRAFLRRHNPELASGFFLDRARLVLVPVGLGEAVRLISGKKWTEAAGLETARTILDHLSAQAQRQGQATLQDVAIDSPCGFSADPAHWLKPDALEPMADFSRVPGLNPLDPELHPKTQIQMAAALPAMGRGGTVTILLPEGSFHPVSELVDLLYHTWKRTPLVRLRFLRTQALPHDLLA